MGEEMDGIYISPIFERVADLLEAVTISIKRDNFELPVRSDSGREVGIQDFVVRKLRI